MRVVTFEQLMDRSAFPRGPDGRFSWNHTGDPRREQASLQFQDASGGITLRYPSYGQPKIILKAGVGVAVESSIAYIIRAAHPETAAIYESADRDTSLFSYEEIVSISRGSLAPGKTFRLRPFGDSDERVTLLGDAGGIVVQPGRGSFRLASRQVLRYRFGPAAPLIDILPCTLPQGVSAREEFGLTGAVSAEGAIGVVASDMGIGHACLISAHPVSLSVALPLPEILGAAKLSVLWDRLTIEGGPAMLLYRWGPGTGGKRIRVLQMLVVRPDVPEAELRKFLQAKLAKA